MEPSQPRRVGHDHLVSLGVAPEMIVEWVSAGILTPSTWAGFYECSSTLDWRQLTRTRVIGRTHQVSLGVSEAQINRWRRRGVLQPTLSRGFYAVTDVLLEWVQRAARMKNHHPHKDDAPADTADAADAADPAHSTFPSKPASMTNKSDLHLVACTITRARAFVAAHHRHLGPPVSGLFAVGVAQGAELVGVAIVGRPVARGLQDGATAEVTRVCTLGTRNACSMLLGACRRGCIALGYHRLVTYTLAAEPGTSLRATGWREVAAVRGRTWNCPSRPRSAHAGADKRRWEVNLPPSASRPRGAARLAA